MGLKFTLLLLKICLTVGALSIDGTSVKFSPSPTQIRKVPATIYPTKPGQPPWVQPDPASSRTRTPPSTGRKRHEYLVAPPEKAVHVYNQHHFAKPSSIAVVPSPSPSGATTKKWVHGPASLPSRSFHKYHHQARKSFRNSALEPSHSIHPPTYSQQGPSVSVSLPPYSIPTRVSPAPLIAPSPKSHFKFPVLPPVISPTNSSLKKMKTPPPFSVMVLPPPPPNADCASVTCTEPLTYTPPGAPCGCVWPIQVKLYLGIAIYTFFPLVSELAQEIAASVQLNHSQVRIIGASSQELEKSTVLINLVPWEVKFDYTTALLIYKKFWTRQVYVKASLFGPYKVVYVRYPGLPPSPPSAASSTSSLGDGPSAGQYNNGQAVKPLGVAVPQRERNGLQGSMITLIVISSFTAFVLCLGIIWFLMLKCGSCVREPEQKPPSLTSFPAKPVGAAMLQGSISSSASMSVSSDAFTYTGSAKNFTLSDIEKATNSFDASRVIGEGGFGVVYRGILEDGTKVAVKVLKREDQRGGREFLAEVEMLSRLHHRNLVKLIGICTEDQTRCLVYELVPNGSLESHLHGVDKETDPLDWGARMKIALGAARGLAYLHEDSSPRVIHRDFKASNILLEHDFTPKVSDFGLARTALDEGNKCISTHVMGTFGYLAPEYAMTGHLLVKSDVYSYGVVLLELLTGRKPVDLSQPPGQENLVAWARPLLTNKEGLETVIDGAIKSNLSFDSITKVAAIASMCVQPEVTHRPFMGEVVQALKLVCNEFEETKEIAALKGCGQESFSPSRCSKVGKPVEASEACHQIPAHNFSLQSNVSLSASASLSIPAGVEEEDSGSSRRKFSSGPLGTGRKRPFWQRIRSLSRGCKSEQEFSEKLWPESI